MAVDGDILRQVDDSREQVGDLREQVLQLARQDVAPRAFFAEFLERAARGLAAVGGAVWLRTPTNQLQLEFQINLAATGAVSSPEHQAYHGLLLAAVAEGDEPRIASPRSGLPGADQAANPTEFLLVACPLKKDNELAGVVELFLRPGDSPTVQQGYARTLAAMCEAAGDYYRHSELRDLRRQAALWSQFEQFARRSHGSLDSKAAAYAIANDGRLVIGCDRLSVAVRHGRKCKLVAVSGLERFDRRSALIRQLQKLIHQVTKTGEPLWYLGDAAELPPQLEQPLETYLDQAHVRHFCLMPLHEPAAEETPRKRRRIVGVLAIEWFEAEPNPDTLRRRVTAVAQHAETALFNALTLESVPFVPLLKLAGAFLGPRRLSMAMLTLLGLLALAAALGFVPADFEIEARGELQPELRRDVFAPHDGIVERVFVKHGDHVPQTAPAVIEKADPVDTAKQGLLARLTNSQLDFELARVTGELGTAEKRLTTVGIRMLQLQNARTNEEVHERDKLAAEAEELKKLSDSLRKQQEVLRRQQREMSVYSPMAGQVLSWNIEQSLARRPVQRGQLLMTLADLKGPWILELHVPDHHMGHVLKAQLETSGPMAVSFILATEPETTYAGRIQHISMTSENHETHGPSVLVTVAIDEASRQSMPELRPGATVLGRIACGRRSLGYVWFHDLIDAVHTWIWF
jgi:multidrug efflux pump subunit AcrA (membrane-fusion protein)